MSKSLSILTVLSCAFLWFSNVWGQQESQVSEEHNPFGSVLVPSIKSESENPLPPTAPAQSSDASQEIQTGLQTEETHPSLAERIISRNLVKKKKGINPQMLSAFDLISEGNKALLLPRLPIASEQVIQKLLSQFRLKKSIASTQWFSKNQTYLQQSTTLQSQTIETKAQKTQPSQSPSKKMADRPDEEGEKSSQAAPPQTVSKEVEDKLPEASPKSNENELVLNGIVVASEGRFAVIQHEETWHIVSEGDHIAGKQVIEIGENEVVLQNGDQQITLHSKNP